MPRSKPKKIDDQPATLHDLDVWGNQLGLRIGNVEQRVEKVEQKIDHVEQRLEKKIDDVETRLTQKIEGVEQKIEDMGNKIMQHIDAAVENRAGDLLGVTNDEVKLIKDKTENHEERLVTLEKHAGVR
jgi:hypothetical protein